jgi:uncharacterized protein
MSLHDLLAGLLIGAIGGVMSGALGVSSGGALVPLSVLLLGVGQHVAQGVSLVAQIFPTSLSGLRHYARHGRGVSWRALPFLAGGFLAGGVAGALLAHGVADRSLQWSFAGYLALLDALLIMRRPREKLDAHVEDVPPRRLNRPGLAAIGVIGGASSGFLGIGGGLAITALASGGMKLPLHQAQALSLAVTALPLTVPAVWTYAQQGTHLPLLAIVGIVVGLWGGTSAGSRIANRLSGRTLRYSLVALVASMAIFMACRAAGLS